MILSNHLQEQLFKQTKLVLPVENFSFKKIVQRPTVKRYPFRIQFPIPWSVNNPAEEK
jgi:hypothetical protein